MKILLQNRFLFLISFSIFLLNQSIAQTGPGGVGNSSVNKIWLDANTLNLVDGVGVSIWPDFSGNGNNFSQAMSTMRPSYLSTGLSGMPTVSYDGINDVLNSGAIPSLESANITYFLVYKRDALERDMMINANYASSFRKWRTYSNISSNFMIGVQSSPDVVGVKFNGTLTPSFLSQHNTPTSMSIYNQGTHEETKFVPYTTPSGHINISLGNQNATADGTYDFGGDISEVIVYTSALNNLQRVLIENYLGAKYNMAIPTDLYDYEATHNIGLIGIGDDGTDIQSIAQGAGIVVFSAPTEMSSGEYLTCGHTNVSLATFNDENLPPALLDFGLERFERTWRVDEIGEVGTINLTFDLSEEGNDFALPATYRLLIDTDEDFSTGATVISGGIYNPVAQTLTYSVNLEPGEIFTLAGIYNAKDINSITDGNWSNPSTWDCTCIPAYRDNVTIIGGDEVTVDVDGFVANLSINAGAILTMTDDFTIEVNEDWEIGGLTNFSNGTIAFVGEVNQNISILEEGEDTIGLFNILINNEAGGNVRFNNRNYFLTGTLSPNAGNLVIDPSTDFIIGSTSASEGGRIGPILEEATVAGNFTVQRFIPPGIASWRDLASPVIGETFAGWDPDLAMSGDDFPDGCAWGPDGCFHSVTYTFEDEFIEVTSVSDPILNGRGFEMFVGNTMTSWDGGVLSSTGSINPSGDITFDYGAGWSTIGNPYASPIAFSTLSLTPEIGNYFYVYDPASGGFEWYDGASGTASIPEITENGLMAIGQGVWIFSSGDGSITYNQANKVENDATYIREAEGAYNALYVTLDENASTFHCTAQLEEKDFATDGFEHDMDLPQLSQPYQQGPSFAFQIEASELRKNFITPDGRDKSFKMNAKIKNEGFYTISIENWGNFRHYQHIYLYDEETGKTVDLKFNNYVFHADVNEEEEMTELERFTLILTNGEGKLDNGVENETTIHTTGTVAITQMDHVIDVAVSEEEVGLSTITVTNVLGQSEVYTIQANLVNGSNIVTLPEHLKGFYIISVKTANQIVNKKVIL